MATNSPKPLKPLRLHELIGQQAAWTDELWHETLKYLSERLDTFDAIQMSAALTDMTGKKAPDAFFKMDYLQQFRDYPPTLLLGIFDVVRARGL